MCHQILAATFFLKERMKVSLRNSGTLLESFTGVPHPGIEPGTMAVKASSPNHWTTREFPGKALNECFEAVCLEMIVDNVRTEELLLEGEMKSSES